MEYYADLNVPTPFGDQLVDRMTEDNIITNNGDSRMALIRGYSFLDPVNVLVKPADCRSDSFGRSGNYTDSICDAVELVGAVCTSENIRGACDISQVPGVVSASNDDFFLQTLQDRDLTGTPKFELVKTAVCMNRVIDPAFDDIYTIALCSSYPLSDQLISTEAADLERRVENYYAMMLYMPLTSPQFWNPLWTNSAESTIKEIDPDGP